MSLIQGSPRVINVGLSGFAEALAAQGVAVIQVDWSPPARGDDDLSDPALLRLIRLAIR